MTVLWPLWEIVIVVPNISEYVPVITDSVLYKYLFNIALTVAFRTGPKCSGELHRVDLRSRYTGVLEHWGPEHAAGWSTYHSYISYEQAYRCNGYKHSSCLPLGSRTRSI